jgi:hypothetical protein
MPREPKPKFSVTVRQTDPTHYSSRAQLPCSSADKQCAEDMACHAMKAVNAMLDYSKSDVRLVPWNVATNERLYVTEKKPEARP